MWHQRDFFYNSIIEWIFVVEEASFLFLIRTWGEAVSAIIIIVYVSEINTNLVVDNVVGVVVRLKPLNVTAEIEIGDSIESTVFYSCQVIGSSSFFLGSCEN